MPVLNTAASRMRQVAATLDQVRNDVLAGLGNYEVMNQNLNGTGFIGTASLASLNTTLDVANTGRQVSQRFQSVIDQINKGAAQYESANESNRAALSNVGVQQT
ncbi:hypothetical protein [Mycobacterium attenuatum]|uniref:hypothetical protein n=1 Tax=Mycobacterium attenuatum TaxID=2341086 RepID=UPI000F2AD2E0|nr:hypothetical protein [Mycobacterium attenuatum]VBA62469.1 hypothetical protein LAUMK41_05860 [Mycobacterium attenuatum]